MLVNASIRSRFTLSALVIGLCSAAACSDDPAGPVEGGGDPENISRVTITLTPTSGGASQTSVIVDPDGTTLPRAPLAPSGTLTLAKGTTYNGAITLLNDLDPKNVVDITAEVSEEANFHRFFYTLSCAGVTVAETSLDRDRQSPSQPLGLKFQVAVAATAATTTTCQLHVELHHFEGAKGNGLGATFDTDLSTNFPVTVQ